MESAHWAETGGSQGGRDQSEMGKGHMAHDSSMASEMLLSLAGNNLLKATFACSWSCSNKQVIKY